MGILYHNLGKNNKLAMDKFDHQNQKYSCPFSDQGYIIQLTDKLTNNTKPVSRIS